MEIIGVRPIRLLFRKMMSASLILLSKYTFFVLAPQLAIYFYIQMLIFNHEFRSGDPLFTVPQFDFYFKIKLSKDSRTIT
jgi:hypothetical protein